MQHHRSGGKAHSLHGFTDGLHLQCRTLHRTQGRQGVLQAMTSSASVQEQIAEWSFIVHQLTFEGNGSNKDMHNWIFPLHS